MRTNSIGPNSIKYESRRVTKYPNTEQAHEVRWGATRAEHPGREARSTSIRGRRATLFRSGCIGMGGRLKWVRIKRDTIFPSLNIIYLFTYNLHLPLTDPHTLLKKNKKNKCNSKEKGGGGCVL